jgi:hypothetical protein
MMQTQTCALSSSSSSSSNISVKMGKEKGKGKGKGKKQAQERVSNLGHIQAEGKASGANKGKTRTKRQIMLVALELGLNEQHLTLLKLLANYQMLTGFQICALSELPQYQYLRPRPRTRSKTSYGYSLDHLSSSPFAADNVLIGGGGSTFSRIRNSSNSGSSGEFNFTKWLSNLRRQQFRRNSRLRKAGFATTTNHNRGDPAIAVWYTTDDGMSYLNSQIPAWSKKGSGTGGGVGGNGNKASQFLQLGHTVGINQVAAGLVLATTEFTNALLRHTYQCVDEGAGEGKNLCSFYRLESDPFYLQFTSAQAQKLPGGNNFLSTSAPITASGGTGKTAATPKTVKAKVKEQVTATTYMPDLSGRIILQSNQASLVELVLKVAGIADLDNMLVQAANAATSVTTSPPTSTPPNTKPAPVALIAPKPAPQALQPPSLSKFLVPDNGFSTISPVSATTTTAENAGDEGKERPSTAVAVWPFFLEYDRATEDPAVFAEKAVALTAIFNDRKVWLQEWGGRFPTVLVVVEANSTHVGKLIKSTRAKLSEQKARWGDNRPSSWWFTTMAAFEAVFTRTQESYYKFVDEPTKLATSLSSFTPVTTSGKSTSISGQGQGQGQAVTNKPLPSTAPIWIPLAVRAKPEDTVKHFDDWVRTLVVAGQDPTATKQFPVTVRNEDGVSSHSRKILVLDTDSPPLRNHPQRNYGMVGLPILNFLS